MQLHSTLIQQFESDNENAANALHIFVVTLIPSKT